MKNQSLKASIPIDDPNLPSYEIDFYQNKKQIWDYLQDVYDGSTTWAIGGKIINLEKAKRFLLQEEAELLSDYQNRLLRSRFDQFFNRAIKQDFSGLLTLFSTDELLPSIQDNLDNIDLQENSLVSFLKKADQLALIKGCCYIYVESPTFDPSIKTRLDLKKSNRRPYLVLLDRSQIINWGYVTEQGKPVLDFVVIKEIVTKPIGKYGSEKKEYYRVLRRGFFEVWEIISETTGTGGNGETKFNASLVTSGTTSITDEIPVVCYSLHDANMECEPPLTNLADLNVEQARLHSYLVELMRKSCLPTLCINDLNPSPIPQNFHAQDPLQPKEKVILGPASVIRNATPFFVEPTCNSINQTIEYEQSLIRQMNQLTLCFLEGNNPNTEMTATQALLQSAQVFANLQTLSSNKESCVQSIFRLWAKYEGESFGGTINVNRSLFKPPLAWTVADVTSSISQGIISRITGLAIFKEQGLISDEQFEKEIEIENELNPTTETENDELEESVETVNETIKEIDDDESSESDDLTPKPQSSDD